MDIKILSANIICVLANVGIWKVPPLYIRARVKQFNHIHMYICSILIQTNEIKDIMAIFLIVDS